MRVILFIMIGWVWRRALPPCVILSEPGSEESLGVRQNLLA